MINLITLPIITLVLLILQAMFAGSEISLLSCDKGRIRSKADQGLPSAKLVMSSINKIEEYVATSLVGENLCIVINTVLVSSFVERAYPQYDPHILSVIILTPLIVIFGQVVPKSIFQNQSNTLVLKTIYFSIIFSYLFKPLLFIVKYLTDLIVRMIGTRSKLITREELMHVLETGSMLESSSKQFRDKILKKIFLFDKTTVEQIMIPMESVTSIDLSKKVIDAKKIIKDTGYSRFPVYDYFSSSIKGVIHAFYLLDEEDNKSLDNYITECFFVDKDYLASKLLDDLKGAKVSMAIVGKPENPMGIVTIEDILEEILGEIQDEHDL
tara:strand:+ start:920 stop:1897 length:978 start_codon:yes stop_codon:yes gene_type:complete